MATGDSSRAATGGDLLRLLDPDPERAEEKYAELFRLLRDFFRWRRCDSPEDLAQETLRRGFVRILSGVQIYTSAPQAFFMGIAKFIVLEQWRRPAEDTSSIDLDDLPSTAEVDLRHVDSQIYLEQCLQRLTPHERDLLERYYEEDDHQALAAALHLTPVNLRIRVYRAKDKLRRLMAQAHAGRVETPRASRSYKG